MSAVRELTPMNSGIDRVPETAREWRSDTLKAFLDECYAPWVLDRHKSGRQAIARIKRAFSGLLSAPLETITRDRVDRYRTEAIDTGFDAASVNASVTCLTQLFNHALTLGVLETHPLTGLQALEEPETSSVRVLSDGEESALLAALKARDLETKFARAKLNQQRQANGLTLLPDLSQGAFADRVTPMVTLALRTGLRKSELFDLRWSDVDLESLLLTVRYKGQESGPLRFIPLSPRASEALLDWRIQSGLAIGYLFPDEQGGRLADVGDAWTKILDDTGIQDFHWDDMRHSFAASLLQKGASLLTVRELCGHTDTSITMQYAPFIRSRNRHAIELMD